MPRRFTKKIIKPGTYDGITVTPDRIQHWVDTHKKMLDAGLKYTPAPYFHDKNAVPVREKLDPDDANAKNNSGFWSKLWVDKEGYLVGEIETDNDEAASKIGKTIKECSLAAMPKWEHGGKVWEDAITHIALTNKAKAPTGDEFVPVVAMSEEAPFAVFSLEMAGGDISDATEYQSDMTDGKGGVGLDTALELLSKHGIELPEDTNETNFLDRLVTGLTAIASHKKEQEGDDLTEQPKGSKTQKPSPIAMSHELEFAASLLSESGLKDPATGEEFTVEGLKSAAEAQRKKVHVSMSAEDRAAVNWATNQAVNVYKQRIKKCVDTFRVSPEQAKSDGERLLSQFAIEFSSDGKQIRQPIDDVLEAWEAIPENTLVGRSYETVEAFSLDFTGKRDGVTIQPRPQGGGAVEMSEKEVDELVTEVLEG